MKLTTLKLLVILVSQIHVVNAQNIGMGITTPGARLDITKPGGDTPTMNIRGSVNVSHFNHGIAEHTYIRGGRMGSNVLINDYAGSGNIGFGTSNPLTRFHFVFGSSGSSSLNGALALEGSNNTYINVLAPDANETGLLFGKPSHAAAGGIVYNNPSTLNGLQFRTNGNITRMAIADNGNVGLGVNNPEFKLDIADRMRIRSGGGFSSAGLYFNRNDNSAVGGFVGMQDDSHVGFWGNPVGWGFTMNTTSGGMRINGSEGSAGQVITSGGAAGGASWTFPVKTYQWGMPNIIGFSSTTEVSLINATIPIAGNSTLIITAHLTTSSGPCFGCSGSIASAILYLDNNHLVTFFVNTPSSSGTTWITNGISNFLATVSPGNHTLELKIKRDSGPAFDILHSYYGGYFSVLVIGSQ